MRHKVAGRKLGRNSAHRRSLLRNLVTSLMEHERLVTTLPKAKEIRPIAEKMISLGKRDTLHSRRQVQSYLLDAATVKKVFDTIAPRFSDRPGGYSRIVRLGPRVGDGADVAVIELLGSEIEVKKARQSETPSDNGPDTEPADGADKPAAKPRKRKARSKDVAGSSKQEAEEKQ